MTHRGRDVTHRGRDERLTSRKDRPPLHKGESDPGGLASLVWAGVMAVCDLGLRHENCLFHSRNE